MLEYKYAQYAKLDQERKQKRIDELKALKADADGEEAPKDDDAANDNVDRWEEMKQSKETLEIYNHKKASSHYLHATITMGQAERTFTDESHKVTVTPLTDPAKVPREVASELFESS